MAVALMAFMSALIYPAYSAEICKTVTVRSHGNNQKACERRMNKAAQAIVAKKVCTIGTRKKYQTKKVSKTKEFVSLGLQRCIASWRVCVKC